MVEITQPELISPADRPGNDRPRAPAQSATYGIRSASQFGPGFADQAPTAGTMRTPRASTSMLTSTAQRTSATARSRRKDSETDR